MGRQKLTKYNTLGTVILHPAVDVFIVANIKIELFFVAYLYHECTNGP